jgi:two-component system CheB/CheR fusion protein
MLKKKSGSSAPSDKAKADTDAGAEKDPKKQEPKDTGKHPAKTAKKSPAPELYLPIVGIGASAGGLEAFTQLLKNLPLDTGMGFILLQHMAPRSHSMLPEILAKVTRLPVAEARDGMRVGPNRIYVTPPDSAMTLEGGVLRLRTREAPRGQHRPIDVFLRSLAQDQGSRAIGVILSGTASDGVLGLQAIKAEGGITFAQEVKTAKYAGMPESAIAAGVVDFVLPPDQIASQLARLAHHPFASAVLPAKEELPGEEQSEFNQILALLKAGTGVDFTHYKHSTIKRRILRRMMLTNQDQAQDYVRLLREQPAEVKLLFEDILINVTSFFREPEAFEALQKLVFPELMRGRSPDDPVRVWVPGCATGEEAYSIAISLLEFLGDMASGVQIQIFATDIEDAVIDKARAGIYPESVAADLGPERLRRFFNKIPGGYQVSKTIRDMCIFARQNLVKDPPFSRLDLISCRNVLIYFGAVLQKKAIPIFHFALKPTGFLLLGKSEALSTFTELFTLVDKKFKIYVKKTAPPYLVIPALATEYTPPGRRGEPAAAVTAMVTPEDLQREADRLVLARFAPAGVIVDENLNILHFRGHTGLFLEPIPGEASLNLMKMAREGLQIELRAAVHAAIKDGTPVRKEGLHLRYNGSLRVVNLEVFPLQPAPALERFFLVTFEDVTQFYPSATKAPEALEKRPARAKKTDKDRQIEELKSELVATKEYLQAVIEEQDTAVEELKSTNEELMSANEELQSINEEMETSKEELQSANEELATLNEELDNRNQELFQANDDLNNLLTAVQIVIVMLGPDLTIRRFNPTAQEMLNLIPADLGRPIGDLKLKVEVPDLEALIKEVLDHLVIREREVQDREGRWFSLRIRPYRTSDNKIDGVVLALVDVDLLKHSLEEAQRARDYAQAIIATMREPLIVLDGKLQVVSANEAYYQTFKVTPPSTEGKFFYELGQGQWNLHRLRQLLSEVLPANRIFQDFEMVQVFPGIGRRTMLLNGRLLPMGGSDHDLILLAIEDVTDRKQAEKVIRESEAKLRDLTQRLLTLQEKERQQLSWELQESLAQKAAALKMQLRTFEKKLPGGDEALREEYRQSLAVIDDIVETLRRRAMDLSPQMLEDLGLAVGLKSLCEDFGLSHNLECDIHLDELGEVFSVADQISIYRIFQEALDNISRHAAATKVTLAAKDKGDEAEFLVEDNGRGFDPATAEATEGVGLAAMAERVRALGGTFKLESQIAVGTRIFFTIPKSRD